MNHALPAPNASRPGLRYEGRISAEARHGPPKPIELRAENVTRALALAAALLVSASTLLQLSLHLTGQPHPFVAKLFYVDTERNLPTAFSCLLLLFAALLLALVSVLEAQRGAPLRHWVLLCLGFGLMTVDEAWSIHERAIEPLRALLGEEQDLGVLYYAWVVPGIVLVALLTVYFWRFLGRLPARTALAFAAAGAIYLGGAIGMELIGGRYDELYGVTNLGYVLIVTIEESLEMAGVIVFIWALLDYLRTHHRGVRLRF